MSAAPALPAQLQRTEGFPVALGVLLFFALVLGVFGALLVRLAVVRWGEQENIWIAGVFGGVLALGALYLGWIAVRVSVSRAGTSDVRIEASASQLAPGERFEALAHLPAALVPGAQLALVCTVRHSYTSNGEPQSDSREVAVVPLTVDERGNGVVRGHALLPPDAEPSDGTRVRWELRLTGHGGALPTDETFALEVRR